MGHVGAFTPKFRETCASFLTLVAVLTFSRAPSLSPNYSDRVGTVLGNRPHRGRRASSSHHRGRALSAPSADGHAHQLLESQPAKEPESQPARQPDSQTAREPATQRASQPKSQRAREPESERAKALEHQSAREPERNQNPGS